jgi:hypothetical protein
MSAKAKKFRKAFPGPLPTGARSCMRTASAGRACDTCGAVPDKLHVPLQSAGGFCAKCCRAPQPQTPKAA